MLSLGLTLTGADFRRLLSDPKAVGVGVLCQVVVIPMLAFGLAVLTAIPAYFAVGLMIIAACPGGVTSNLLTHLARGDTALSVSLTAIVSLAGAFTLPLVVNFALFWFVDANKTADFSLFGMIFAVLSVTTLPLVIGMSVRRTWPVFTDRILYAAQKTSTTLFAFIVLATFAAHWEKVSAHVLEIGAVVAVLNVLAMGGAYLFGGLFRLKANQSRTIVVECGMQNAAIGIFVSSSLLAVPETVIPALIYALVMNLTVITFVSTLRLRARSTAKRARGV